MKFRISPAAAAVFLAAGLFTSGLRAASAPAAIPFENDAAFNVTLSNTNPSKVVVDGELITSISGPTGAYDQSQTEDGALILSPLVGQNFTLFIQTDHGSSLSLNVRPQPGNGKTLRFTPISPPLRKNDDAKAWEEGQTYEKTLVALSRAVVNGQVPDDYREPALALPVYDNNGRSAGLALVSLVASPEGRMTQGETRMVMTERARGAVLQRSQSGNTIVASDLTAALDAVRNHPKDGVVWQTSDEPPSAYLLKVSGGSLRREEEGLAQRINAKESDILLSAKAERNETASETVDLKAALAQEEARRQQQEPLISKALLQENATKDVEEKFMYTDPDVIHIRPDMLTDSDGTESIKPDSRVLKQIAASDSNAASEAGRELRHESQPETARSGKEQHAASLIVNQLANSERDIVRQPDAGERGRMPEHDEQTLSRTIQKER